MLCVKARTNAEGGDGRYDVVVDGSLCNIPSLVGRAVSGYVDSGAGNRCRPFRPDGSGRGTRHHAGERVAATERDRYGTVVPAEAVRLGGALADDLRRGCVDLDDDTSLTDVAKTIGCSRIERRP